MGSADENVTGGTRTIHGPPATTEEHEEEDVQENETVVAKHIGAFVSDSSESDGEQKEEKIMNKSTDVRPPHDTTPLTNQASNRVAKRKLQEFLDDPTTRAGTDGDVNQLANSTVFTESDKDHQEPFGKLHTKIDHPKVICQVIESRRENCQENVPGSEIEKEENEAPEPSESMPSTAPVLPVPEKIGSKVGTNVQESDEEWKIRRDKLIQDAVRASKREVSEKDARFFEADVMKCAKCGMIGHMSYDCEEEVEEKRCKMCGKIGPCPDKKCPDEIYWRCTWAKSKGHAIKEEEEEAIQERRVGRTVEPTRTIAMMCYVCGSRQHNDCSIKNIPQAKVSCSNCGMDTHHARKCPEPTAKKWIDIIKPVWDEQKKIKLPKELSDEERKARRKQNFRAELVIRLRETTKPRIIHSDNVYCVDYGEDRDKVETTPTSHETRGD